MLIELYSERTGKKLNHLKGLKTNIKRHGGRAGVFIHPYFAIDRDKFTPIQKKAYRRNIDRTISWYLRRKLPLIFLEEAEQVDKLQSRVEGLANEHPYEAYVIKTLPSMPIPSYSIDGESCGHLGETAEVFRKLGVRQMILGGSYLYAYPEDNRFGPNEYNQYATRFGLPQATKWSNQMYPSGCVGGGVKWFLQQGIDIQFSHASFPNAPDKE